MGRYVYCHLSTDGYQWPALLSKDQRIAEIRQKLGGTVRRGKDAEAQPDQRCCRFLLIIPQRIETR